MIDANYLRACFEYNPKTGELIWRVREDRDNAWNGRFAGKVAGSHDIKGYIVVGLFGRLWLAHIIIWTIVYGEWPVHYIDHHDRCKDNNRIDNLRKASNSQNQLNSKVRKSALGLKGVCFIKHLNKYAARISFEGIKRYVGYSECPAVASFLYQIAADKFYGEFANPFGNRGVQ